MKKSTERKRLKRMQIDSRRLFLHGLISNASFDKIQAVLKTAEKKL